MNTTSLIVDILIIGIQVLIWVFGLLFSFLLPVNEFMLLYEKSSTIFILILISTSYTLGIIFDYIISNFFSLFKSKEEKGTYRDGLIISVLNFDIEIQKFLENQYARLRIAKGTLFNLPLITIATCLFIASNDKILQTSKCETIAIVIGFGIIMTIISYLGWRSRNKVYWGYIIETLKIIDKKNNTGRKQD